MNLFYKTNQLIQRVLLAVLCLSFGVVQAQTASSTNFNGAAGNIVVAAIQVGTDNGLTNDNGASPVRLIEFSNNGTPTGAFYQFAWQTTDPTTDYLVQSFNATSNGYIDLSEDGNFLAIAGYSTTRTATPSGVVASSVNRVIARVGGATNGTSFLTAFNTRTNATAFTGDNLRSATLLGGNFYAAGNGSATTGGVHKFNPTALQVCSTTANVRVVKQYGGRLYYSTGSGTQGIFVIGGYTLSTNTATGSAPNALTTANQVIVRNNPAGADNTSRLQNTSPYDFSFKPSTGDVVYLTDDQADGDGGIYKYVWSGGAWSFACKFSFASAVNNTFSGAYGIYVDWTTTNPTIYATTTTSQTAGGNSLVKFQDPGNYTGGVEVNVYTGADLTATGYTVLATAQSSTGATTSNRTTRFVGITKAPNRTDVVPTKLVIQNINSGLNPTRYRNFTVAVQAQDNAGNPGVISTSSVTPITMAVVTGTGTLSTTSFNFPANAVSATFNVSLSDAGAHVISVADGRGTPILTADDSPSFTVDPAATSLVFSGLPSNTSSQSQFGFAVTATKDDLSTETTFPGSCVITSNGAMGAANYTANFVNGVASFTGVEFSNNGTFTLTANAAGLPALTATSENIVVAGGPQTYTWVGADSALWSAPTSWSPERTTPATSDRILFNGGIAIVKVDVNTQSIATFRVINGADVKLVANSTTDKVFSIGAGVVGTDFEITAGSKLSLSSKFASTGIKLNLLSGNFGSIAGSIYFTSELVGATSIDNQITAAQAYSANTAGIEVLGTAYVEQGLRQTGNAFGATTANSIKFRNHAQFRQNGSGSNVFGLGAGSSVVDFEPNARFILGSSSANSPAISGRTYPIFEVDADYTFTNGFTSNWTVNRFRINAGKTFTFSVASPGSTTSPLIIDTMEIGANARYTEVFAHTSRNMSFNAISTGSGATLQFAGAALNLNFTAGSSLKALTNISSNTITVTAPVVVDSVVAPVGGNIVSNGNIILNATAQKTAYVAGHTGIAGQVTGNVTVRRFIRPTFFNGTAVRHLSHPFTAMVAGALANPINANQIQVWNENSNASVAGSGWSSISEITTPIAPGQGFAFNVAANSTVSVTGNLNSGDVVREITRSASGWNLVGNPYAQTIDWDAVTTDAAFDATKIFSGRYDWVSASANTGGWMGYNNGFPTFLRYMAPMTATLVRVKTGNPTVNLTFKNAHRSTVIANALSRSAVDTRPAIELTLDRGANTIGDITSIYFQNGATGFFNDAMDAQRIGNNTGMPTLYTVVNNANYAVKGLPNLTNELVVPLGIRFHTAGTHRLSVANLQNMDGYNVYFINYNTGTSELLTATSVISISGAANTTIDNYAIHFVPLNVTSVGSKVNAETVAVYPNPSTDGKFNVALANVTTDGVATVTVINTLGQVVAKQTANVTAGANQIAVSTAGLKAGTYSVQVRTANSTVNSNVVVR